MKGFHEQYLLIAAGYGLTLLAALLHLLVVLGLLCMAVGYLVIVSPILITKAALLKVWNLVKG